MYVKSLGMFGDRDDADMYCRATPYGCERDGLEKLF